MPVHATTSDLTQWLGDSPPENARVLLRSASLLIDRETVTAVYEVNRSTGIAVEPDVVAALRDATCAQAAAWAALGIDPSAGPAGASSGQVVAKTLGSARIEYDRPSGQQSRTGAAREAAVTGLCAEAVQILAAANLLGGPVWVRG